METKKKISPMVIFITILVVFTGTLLKSQNVASYPIQNSTNCRVTVYYEAWDNSCWPNSPCDFGTQTISASGIISIGGSCPNIFDVHVVLTHVDGTYVGAFYDVGDMSNSCINSSGTTQSAAYPAGLNCTGTWNMSYSSGGTTIW